MIDGLKEQIAKVNELLAAGEPNNISHDAYAGYTGYKPQYVVQACNEGLGYDGWGFEELEMKVTDTLAICHVSVWIKDVKPKTAWGQSRITKGDIGDAMKGAQTDALKKGLAYFDIGDRAYFGLLPIPDKTKAEVKPAFIPKPKAPPKPISNLPLAPFSDEPILTPGTLAAIETAAEAKGISMEAIRERALAKYGVDLDFVSEEDGQEILKALKK